MQKFVAYAARIATLITLLGLLYYVVNDDFLITHDNKKTAALCIEEAENGCPLLLEALEEKALEVEALKGALRQLQEVQNSSQAFDGGPYN